MTRCTCFWDIGDDDYGIYGYDDEGNKHYINQYMLDKEVAAALAILLGAVGAHYFYCKKKKAGLIFLAITVLSCGYLAIFTAGISIIQGILILVNDYNYFLKTYVESRKILPLF